MLQFASICFAIHEIRYQSTEVWSTLTVLQVVMATREIHFPHLAVLVSSPSAHSVLMNSTKFAKEIWTMLHIFSWERDCEVDKVCTLFFVFSLTRSFLFCKELGTHFINNLWAYYWNLPKKNLNKISIPMIWSGHNFAHAMTAQLSWHVQNYDLIGSLSGM